MQRVVAVLLLLVGVAHADTGVVVGGDPNMQASVMNAVQRWVQDRHLQLVASPLGDSTTAIVDCFVMDDIGCAKKIFEEHSRASAVVFVRVDLEAERTYNLNAYWFAKGHDPVNEKRPCAQCDDAKLRAAVDTLMTALAKKGAQGTGTITVRGPSDVHVKVDGNDVGAVPVDREVAPGSHEIVFLRDNEPIDVRRVEVEAGATLDLNAPQPRAERRATATHRSAVLPIALVAGGLVAAAVGGTFMYYGSLRGPNEPYVYTNATEIGLPIVIAGAFAVGAGTSLWFSGSDSDARVGVTGAF